MTPILAAHAVNSLPLSTFGPLLPKVGTFSDHLIIFESNFLALKGPFLLKGPFHLNVVEKKRRKIFQVPFFWKTKRKTCKAKTVTGAEAAAAFGYVSSPSLAKQINRRAGCEHGSLGRSNKIPKLFVNCFF